jgi:hypothetical protein
MKKWVSLFLVCLHLNTWMLVPHIQHDSPVLMTASNADDLDSFFEYIDEIIFSHIDQTPDHGENDGQLLDEVSKEDFCEHHNLPTPIHLRFQNPCSITKKASTSEYKERISLDIIAPPPDLV